MCVKTPARVLPKLPPFVTNEEEQWLHWNGLTRWRWICP
jgi:hypothetical protein